MRPPTKPRSFFMKLFGRGDPVLNDEGNERRKEAFIEDAIDREKVMFGPSLSYYGLLQKFKMCTWKSNSWAHTSY